MNSCIFCGKSISIPLSISFIFSFEKLKESSICNACFDKFNPIDLEQACSGCSRAQNDRALCSDCKKWEEEAPNLKLNHTALFTYNEMAKEYMKNYKFEGDVVLAELFTEEISKSLRIYQNTHHIVPIPISKESMASRGFNQVHLILEKAGIPYKEWLSHNGKGQRQSSKNRKDRLLSKQFLAVHLEPEEYSQINKPILIVDDVYTTGRTILHAKNAFYSLKEKAGSIKIESFSIFR